MKKGTKIAIAIIVIVLILAACIAFFVIKDLNQEKTLISELDSLYNLIEADNIDYTEVNKKLDQRVTSGDYEVLESSIKTYISDIMKSIEELEKVCTNEDAYTVLSAENIKNDGPDFTKSKQLLSDTKNNLAKITSDLDTYFTEEKTMTYINDKNLDDYYINLFKDYVFEDKSSALENEKNNYSKNLEKLNSILSTEEDAINLLVKNKRSWNLENDSIVFNAKSLSNEYNKLVDKLSDLSK